ncbi:MAG: recombinase family protein [Sphingosinicella sp.]|nr:recombinase family protein [Sphingosinicella sp.]
MVPRRRPTGAVYVSYLRVSTQRQGQSGLGIEAQRTAVDQYLGTIGGTLLEEHIEVESGSNRHRPILLKSIAQAKKAGATLVIAKLDRLARNVAFVSALMEAGVEFVAVDFPAANKLLIHIMAAVAEHERMLISERTKAALAVAKSRGVRLGVNGQRLAEQHKAAAMEFAQTLREPVLDAVREGARTLQNVADQLNRGGQLTREGALWSPMGVRRLMHRLDLRTAARLDVA